MTNATPESAFARLLAGEVPVQEICRAFPDAPLSDDRPVHEYYLLRRYTRGDQR